MPKSAKDCNDYDNAKATFMDQVKFTAMKDGDKEDYDFLTEHETAYTKGTADRLLQALVDLDEGLSGYQVTRLGHSLQAATRAERDGADTDWIVAALLHDIGDIYAPYNHDEYAASILRPFVREQKARGCGIDFCFRPKLSTKTSRTLDRSRMLSGQYLG